MRLRKIWWGSGWWFQQKTAVSVFWIVGETLGELCEVSRCILWRGLKGHCPMYSVSCIFFSKCLYFSWSFFKKDFIHLFLERRRNGERGEKYQMCGCLLHAPNQGPDLQPRHVPWLRVQLVTLWFTGWHSTHWATLARAKCLYFSYTWLNTFWTDLAHIPPKS